MVLLDENQDGFSMHKPTTIDVDSLETVLDMLHDDYLSKHPQPPAPVPKLSLGGQATNLPSQRSKVYPNSEILRILQKLLDHSFKQPKVYEMTAAGLEHGTDLM